MPGKVGRPKGLPKSGGRQKGTPNKMTRTVKEALQEAFEGIGGTGKLQLWATENPTEFYKLWSKILPQEVNVGSQEGNPLLLAIQQVSGTALPVVKEIDEDDDAA